MATLHVGSYIPVDFGLVIHTCTDTLFAPVCKTHVTASQHSIKHQHAVQHSHGSTCYMHLMMGGW